MIKLSIRLVPIYMETVSKIRGPGCIVEIDETKIGKRKYHKGHYVEGVWVVGIVERTKERRTILIDVEKRDSEALTNIVLKYVKKDTMVYTDCWGGYNKLSQYGYIHITINHSINFVDPQTGAHTNTIEGYWCALKKNNSYKKPNKKTYKKLLGEVYVVKERGMCIAENIGNSFKLMKFFFQ